VSFASHAYSTIRNEASPWNEEAAMDLTTNIGARKSSLGLSALQPPGEDTSVHSDDVGGSACDSSGEQPEPTEFRAPLGSSLRRPEPLSVNWLALRAMKHSGGDSPHEPQPSDADEDEGKPVARGGGAHLGEEDLDITKAETRLGRA